MIAIDNKSMLRMVMQALGAKEMPIFTEMSCGQQGVKFSIKLDVSSAKYFVGQTITAAVVEGEPSNSKVLAEKRAVMRAIKLLNDRNLIRILDYSSRVAGSIETNNAFGDVNAALFSLEKLIAQCDITLAKCKSLSVKLDAKDAHNDAVEHECDKWDMYGSLKEYMGVLVDMFTTKVTRARARATDLEFQRKKYHNKSTEKYQAGIRKVIQTSNLVFRAAYDPFA